MSKACDQHLLVSDMPEELSKNVIDAVIRENIGCVWFFSFKDGFGVFLLLSNLGNGLVIWLVKNKARNPPTLVQVFVSFGGNSRKGYKSDTAAVLRLPCQLKRTKLV